MYVDTLRKLFGVSSERMLYSNIAMSRILSYDPNSGLVETWCENTEGTNGLNYDAEGRLFGCSGDGRKIVRFDPNGEMVTVADRLDGRRINSPNDLAITPSGSIYFSDPNGIQLEFAAWTHVFTKDDVEHAPKAEADLVSHEEKSVEAVAGGD